MQPHNQNHFRPYQYPTVHSYTAPPNLQPINQYSPPAPPQYNHHFLQRIQSPPSQSPSSFLQSPSSQSPSSFLQSPSSQYAQRVQSPPSSFQKYTQLPPPKNLQSPPSPLQYTHQLPPPPPKNLQSPLSFTFTVPSHFPKQIILASPLKSMSFSACHALKPNKYSYVSIRSGKWQQLHIPEICSHFKQWALECPLILCSNKQPEILAQILHIRFPNLKKLDLGGNNITTVEMISHLQFPALKKINLKDNNLTNITPLRKSTFLANLEDIDLWGNPIAEIASFSQINNKKLLSIQLEYYDDVSCFFDCRSIVKVESQGIREIMILSEMRIKEKLFYEQLTKRRIEGDVEVGVFQSENENLIDDFNEF